MRISPAFSSPAVRWAGLGLVAAALALGVALVVFVDGDADDDSDDPVPLPSAIDTADGWTVEPVGWVPGATALGTHTGPDRTVVRATDTQLGRVYEVADPEASEPSVVGSVPFDSIPRLDRAWPDTDGETLWVAEGSELRHLDADGTPIGEVIALEQPAAIAAVTPEAVWLTVSGVPLADHSGVIAPRSAIQRVDVGTGEVLLLPVDDPVTFRFAVTDEAAWATVGATVQKLDLTTIEPVATVDLEAPATALVVDDGTVVVVASDGTDVAQVVRLDAATAAVDEVIALDPGETGEAAVVGSGSATELWVLRPGLDRVDRVAPDGSSREPVAVAAPRRIEVVDDDVWLLGGLEDGVLLLARR